MIFVDTSGFYALEVSTDKNHAKARDFLKELKTNKYGRLATTDYVLDETYTLLRMRTDTPTALEFIRKIIESKSIEIIWIDEVIFRKSLEYASRYKNLKLSLTDCTSFATMTLFNISVAFTFDEHFKKVGFTTRPR